MNIETHLTNWTKRFFKRVRNKNIRGVLRHLYWWWVGLHLSISSRYSLGTKIYDRDWDLLIILDACRVDALKKVEDEYSFINDIKSVRSVGSTSGEWVAKNFTSRYRNEISETGLVTANAFYEKILENKEYPPHKNKAHSDMIPVLFPRWSTADMTDFRSVNKVWNYTERDAGGGGFPPRAVTDRAITMAREEKPNRMIVHYMQPHSPYIPVEEDIKSGWLSGTISREEAMEAYLENLRYVLDDVEILLDNIDAENVVIAADHGEAFAEWGKIKGHMMSDPNPCVKRVPWVATTATDNHTHIPEYKEKKHELGDDDLTDRLKDLGYFK